MLPKIRQLIAFRAKSEPNKDRQVLAEELIGEIKEKFPTEIPPVSDTVIKKISEARNKEVDALDTPWHMGTLEEYPLPAGAIARVLEVQNLQLQYEFVLKDFNGGVPFQVPLTIRQAKWISRLCEINGLKDAKVLFLASLVYWIEEVICEIARTPFDTSQLDRIVAQSQPLDALKSYGLGKYTNKDDLQGLYRYLAGYASPKTL